MSAGRTLAGLPGGKSARFTLLFAATIVWSLLPATPGQADELLVDPTGDQLCLLYYRMLHTAPPVDDFAKQAVSVRRANEFEKKAQESTERTRLTAQFDALSGVKFLRVNILMSFSEYDAGLGEYTLTGFGANSYVPFDCFGTGHVNLRIDNSPYAQSWVLSAGDAEQVLKRNKGSRDIVAVSKIEVTGAETVSQGPRVLVGKLREVGILGRYTNARLGGFAVPEK